MKNLLLNNWQAKLISFVIALVIWAYIRNSIEAGFIDQLFTGTFSVLR